MPAKAPSSPQTLTLDRIYGTPDLDGADISLVEWSPDGKFLTYLINRGESVELIGFEVTTGKRRVLFDWARILGPTLSGSLGERNSLGWDAEGEPLPWRVKSFKPLDALSLNYIWSPNGKVMMLAVSGSGPYYLFDLASETLSPKLAIDPAASDVEFSPDGRWLTYVLNYNLFVLDTTNGQSTPLTQAGTDALRYATSDTLGDFPPVGYWWSPDSARLACLVTDESTVPQFAMQVLTSPVGELVRERYPEPGDKVPSMTLVVLTAQGQTWIANGSWQGYYVARVRWLPDSKHLAVQLLNREQNHLVLAIADTDTGQLYPILEERAPTWINLADDLTFLADGKMFLWTSERESYRYLYLYSIDGRQLAQLTSGELASVGVYAVDEKNGAVYFRAYPSPFVDAHLMRVTYRVDGPQVVVGPLERLTRGPGTHAVTFSPDYSYFAEQFSTVTTPPALNLYTRDGTFHAAVEENVVEELAGLLQPVEFPPLLPAAKTGHPSDDMLLCHRIIYPPDMKGGQRYPVIVYVYGGPVSGGSSRAVVNKWVHVPDLWAQMMAGLGFIVYSLDNRGSCEAPRGHRFESAIRYNLGHVELADQLEGVKYLQSLPCVDPARIGVFGGSFGGFMALNCMTRAPEVFKAGVAFAPVTDWSSYDAVYTEQYMGQPRENPEGYRNTAIPAVANDLQEKLLLLHGAADQNVHVHHTFSMVNALVSAGRLVELMMYPGMGHADFFRVTPIAQQLFERITRFFVDHL